ncbi:helix-turn-helix domain-containing protein [Bacillus sp. Bva_UNVM-123]|uniref:AraC family transcriptional regulator n=1 Tax=Bacillus sp. Bva_UNVM-123 TaxID=2829798 RepID=UPI00391F1766
MLFRKGLIVDSCKEHHQHHSLSKRKRFIIQSHFICYVIGGEAEISINGIKHSVHQNTCIFLYKGATIELHNAENLQYYLLQYSETTDFFSSKKQVAFMINNQTYQLKSTLKVLEVMRKLSSLNSTACYLTWLKQQSLFFELLWLLQNDKEQKGQAMDTGIELSMKYLHDHYDRAIDIGSLHKHAGMAKQSFCRAFKKETGVTPTEYLRKIRMKKAKEMLMQPAVYIKDVAAMLGYEDELYFSRLFKRTEGQSPTLYRKNNVPRIAVISKLFLQDHLLSLGVKPVVVPCYPSEFPNNFGLPSYLQKHFSEAKYVNVERDVNLADVMAIDPHFILTTNRRNDYDARLENMDVGVVQINRALTWQDYQRSIAVIIKKEAEAEKIIQEMDCAERKARDCLRKVTKVGEWVVLRVIDNQFLVHGVTGHSASDLIFTGLGFQAHHQLEFISCSFFTIEEMLALNPERIMILWSKQADIIKMAQNPLWWEIDAVKRNEVFVPNSGSWDPWGPYGRKHMISSIVQFFSTEAHLSM